MSAGHVRAPSVRAGAEPNRQSMLNRVIAAAKEGLSVQTIAVRLSITPGLVETMLDHGNRAGLIDTLDLAGCRSDSGPGCSPGSKPGCAGCPLMPVDSLLARLRRAR